jgi:hypothetical protein
MEAVMLFLMLCAVMGDVSHDTVRRDNCDIIEVNRVYTSDWQGRNLDQLLFWRFKRILDDKTGKPEWRFHVHEWRKIKTESKVLIHYDYKMRKHVLIFYDATDNVMRIVYATSFRETRTNYDVEVEDRKKLPINCRTPVLGK